jgi:hypothetical protein
MIKVVKKRQMFRYGEVIFFSETDLHSVVSADLVRADSVGS